MVGRVQTTDRVRDHVEAVQDRPERTVLAGRAAEPYIM
jgi:hypothetical protein